MIGRAENWLSSRLDASLSRCGNGGPGNLVILIEISTAEEGEELALSSLLEGERE